MRTQLTLGILAHVDAGKTTLSEAMLYQSGRLRRLGRVDHKDAFLDTEPLERERGITIFSKQAVFPLGERDVTLLDTPGHADFSSEMERTLQVLDCAVLVISGTDGVQAHTRTLWRLLERYQVPTFLFVNKMDLPGADRETLLAQLRSSLDDGCVDFSLDQDRDHFYESAAMCSEEALEHYLSEGTVPEDALVEMVARDYGPDVWVADPGLVEEALECSFSSAQCSDGLLWLNFGRRGVELESWIAQYGLSLEGPTHAWLWQPEDEEIYREDVRGIVYSIDIGASLEPVDAFSQDKLAWEEDPDHPGFEKAALVVTPQERQPVRWAVRWKAQDRAWRAEFPEDCLEAFWAVAEDLPVKMTPDLEAEESGASEPQTVPSSTGED